jgi:FkbM family methyltransferase
MTLEPNECVDGWVLFHPQIFDWTELQFLKKHTPQDGCFVDVGANIGFYSLALSRHATRGSIISIEADPYNVRKLNHNIRISAADNVLVFDCGVADKRGEFKLKLNTTGNRGGNSFAIGDDNDTVDVRCVLLGDVLEDARAHRVDSMKLDIEGFEFPVLEAFFETAPEALWPRAMVVEVEPDFRTSSQGDVLELLRRKGYQLVGRSEANHLLLRTS